VAAINAGAVKGNQESFLSDAHGYFSSLKDANIEVLLATVRDHWAIENALHWQLDVSFREDAARNRKVNGLGNIAVLRRRALDVIRPDTSKGSLGIKLKRAGWDAAFLCSVLNGL
jgi:predicted transposase YbfD/YdcC